MDTKRFLFYALQKQLAHKNALVVTGMRQVGKTTVLRQLYNTIPDLEKLWFDFDNPLDQKIFESLDYRSIYVRLCHLANTTSPHRLVIFIDEIQNFPAVTKVMKYLIDHFHVKFIVTGSSSFYLKNLFPESLSGRKFLYELPPLSFTEILHFRDTTLAQTTHTPVLHDIVRPHDSTDCTVRQEYYLEYLTYGGFPEVVLTPSMSDKQLVLNNIFASFFEKDLQLLSDYKDIRELRDLILLLAPRVGSLVDITRLANELGVDRKKIYAYLDFLQGTFFLRLLPRFSHSIDRAVAGGKKVYFTDTGILQLLGAVNEAQIFENAVVNQLADYGQLSFYNKRHTAEIDVILNKTMAFEIKTTGTEHDLTKLEKLAHELKLTDWHIISKNHRPGERFMCGALL